MGAMLARVAKTGIIPVAVMPTGSISMIIKNRIVIAFLILIFSLIPIFTIHRYVYGVGAHAITIPFMKAFLTIQLYPDDYLLPERAYFITYFWNTLAIIINYFHLDMTVLFFAIYLLSVYFTFTAVYLIAMALFGRTEVAFLSLFFLLFDKSLLGASSVIPDYLANSVAATPLLLFSIYFFLREKYVLSFFLQGIGFLIHPLSTSYVIAILFLSSIAILRHISARTFMSCLAVFLVTASPSLIWRLTSTPESLHFFYADPRWLELLRLRSPHHVFPFTWPADDFLRTALLIYVFFLSWKYRPKPLHHRIVACSTGVIFALWVIGTIFTEFVPVSVVVQFQLFRSSTLLLFFAYIYYANYFYTEIQSEDPFNKYAAPFLAIGIFYGANHGRPAYIAFLALAIFFILYHSKLRKNISAMQFISVLLVVACLLGAGVYRKTGHFSINNVNESNWVDVQKWAKHYTSSEDMFIVPPQLNGFRIESERSLYSDWKDGTQMFFNPAFGYEWFRRMKALGYKNGESLDNYTQKQRFEALDEDQFKAIAQEAARAGRKVFLVMFKERESFNFPITYSNDKYVVYEIEH